MSWTRFTEVVLPTGALLLQPQSSSNGLRLSPETQNVTITGTPTGGTFTLTFNNLTTAAIAYNATAAQVASALQALANVGPVGCACFSGPLPGANVLVQFIGALFGPQPLMTANGAALTGGSSPTVTVVRLTVGTVEAPPASGAAGAGPAAMVMDGFPLMTSAQLGNPPTLAAMATAYHAATGTAAATGMIVDAFV
jgi:hypothetical protein